MPSRSEAVGQKHPLEGNVEPQFCCEGAKCGGAECGRVSRPSSGLGTKEVLVLKGLSLFQVFQAFVMKGT